MELTIYYLLKYLKDREPEWLDDDGDLDDGMTFDERGQFISVKVSGKKRKILGKF